MINKKLVVFAVIAISMLSGILVIKQVNKARLLTPVALATPVSSLSNQNQMVNGSGWVAMWRYGDSLLLCTQYNFSGYENWIVCINDSDVQKVFSMNAHAKDCRYIGVSGQYFYYYDSVVAEGQDRLYCFDSESCTEKELYQGNIGTIATTFFAEDGSIYLPLERRIKPNLEHITMLPAQKLDEAKPPQEYLHISGDVVLEVTQEAPVYRLGAYTYFYREYDSPDEEIFSRNLYGDVSDLLTLSGARRTMLPYPGGILVHNGRMRNILCNITPYGTVEDVFDVPGMYSESAVCIVGNKVYLSFKRYEKYGDIGMRQFENDTYQGTYEIDLSDFSYKKISDRVFISLYQFDDQGMYGVGYDEKLLKADCIYHIDWNGVVTPIFGSIMRSR